MTLQISSTNNVVYQNKSSQTFRITIVASGDAKAEVLPQSGAAIERQSFGRKGGALSLDVPADHRVEIDVAGSATIGVEFVSAAPNP